MIVAHLTGRLHLAQKVFKQDAPDTDQYLIGLLVNVAPLVAADDIDDVEPAGFTGYAAVNFTKADNGAPAMAGTAARTLLTGDYVEWTATGAHETVTGWYLATGDGNTLIFSEEFPDPIDTSDDPIIRLYPYVDLGKLVAD